ncbi:MAG TPA: DUF6230 family protein [Streptosporangiaceae bacterium]|nr:DUF6230 family protein [Streptosporangiaceae bacterium]
MSSENIPATGKVRWRRFALLMIPAGAITAILVGLTATGSIAASISVSGTAFEVTATQLTGTGFEQYGGIVSQANGTQHPVAVSAIRNASLTDLCQAVKVGPFTLVLRAGGGGTSVSAANLVVDADQQSGNATFHNISIGQDASTLTEDPGNTGAVGGFGEQADTITIDNLRQHTWLTTAGTFTLPGLSLSFNSNGC